MLDLNFFTLDESIKEMIKMVSANINKDLEYVRDGNNYLKTIEEKLATRIN